jgi:phage terminase small subunit
MPAAKPSSLSNKHSTKDEQQSRADDESAMTPTSVLTDKPPAELTGHKRATAVWKRLIKIYGEVEASIATAFDQDLLVKYCLLEQECLTMQSIRDATLDESTALAKQIKTWKLKFDNVKDYIALLEQKNALLSRYQGLDARLDGKRKLLHSLAQSLYLTPRSRAGVEPKLKENKKPDQLSEFDD